ncbi:MAG: peptidoglycan-binding protein [Methylococcales bacterium]
MSNLKQRSFGPEVTELQEALKAKGFDPGMIDGEFGPNTEMAVIAFQKSAGLTADGIAREDTLAALGLKPALVEADIAPEAFEVAGVTVDIVAKMFPKTTPQRNIVKYLPPLLEALHNEGLADKNMILMALGTIRAETEGFEPISEFKSIFNTSSGGHPFDKYDNRRDLGNKGRPDGESFKGRGFIQLTGRFNYGKYSAKIGSGDELLLHPEKANDPAIAAELLAKFLKDQESDIRKALAKNDLAKARKLVNGGSHGLDRFEDTFNKGIHLID